MNKIRGDVLTKIISYYDLTILETEKMREYNKLKGFFEMAREMKI